MKGDHREVTRESATKVRPHENPYPGPNLTMILIFVGVTAHGMP